jgi:CheY-like chemotaxis protein
MRPIDWHMDCDKLREILLLQESSVTRSPAPPTRNSAQEDIAYYFRLQQSDRAVADRRAGRAWWSWGRVPVKEVAAQATAGANADRPWTGRDVLVVDDNPESIEPIVRMLRHGGCDADCVASAADALSSLAAKRPKLVLLDIAMPHMDGIELLKELRRRPETHDLPVVMLTAHPLREEEALALGALDFIVKPIELPALRQRLAKFL